ncbi:hypothetical protein [Metallosphaera hakonensis]|uniref:hypothetical protein n=1 Tax=Metallosphaera hakonensis TaxID=79601 RepID=UPI000A91D06F|nr:hypothetical protein [Metallosphaera hakonensis]
MREEDKLVYPYQLTVNADVPGNVLMERVRNIIEDEFKGIKAQPPDISFYSKNGSTNVFLVSIKLDEIKNLNHYLSIINQSFEKAYWELKGK